MQMSLRLPLWMLGCLAGLSVWAGEGVPSAGDALKEAGLELDVKKHEVRAEATVCIERGILEYLVCIPNTFEHEALFSIRCKPSVLHLGLLAIGLEPGSLDGEWPGAGQEQSKSRVCIEVEYEVDGKTKRHGINEFLLNRKQQDVAVPNVWIFTGSYFGRREEKRVYAADVMGGVIGLGMDGASVLQSSERMGNPYQGDEQGLEINTDTVPAKGTKVQLIFTPAPQKPQKPKESQEPQVKQDPGETGKEAKEDPVRQ